MPKNIRYPREWLERIPAEVFACLKAGELRITVMPRVGFVDGGVPWDVPTDKVPPHLRMPNSKLWIRVNENWEIQEIWERDDLVSDTDTKRRNWKQLQGTIHEILIHDWDPIGCGVPDDEYDSYIPGICRLLLDGADDIEIGLHLEHLQTVNMGLQGNEQRNRRIASLLIERTRALV
jgi:hypothetical protein